MPGACRRVGLISDTHGLLRPQALETLRGSDLIIHAGDIGTPAIIEALRRLAPVVAVRGNIDRGNWSCEFPERAIAEAGTSRIYVLHDLKELDIDPASAGYTIVVSGHSHKPSQVEHSGVLYVNPGSAGPRRFRLPVTVARVDLERCPWEVEFVELLIYR